MHIPNEYYHVYNRGAHKAPIFLDKLDYERFLALLYSTNDMRRIDLRRIRSSDTFMHKRTPIVDVFSYCLMPNHFHIGVKEIMDRGLEKFMRKLCTSYVMYFNKKYSHSGTIFQGEYKSKHIGTDDYLRYLVQYIHLNPFGIEEPDLMKTAKPEYLEQAIVCSKAYPYSSYKDYLGETRRENGILTSRIGAG